MVKYDGYVNSFLDQYTFFKKKHKNDLDFLNNQVKSMYQFFDYAMHLAENSIKFKLPDNAELFDFKDDMLIADVFKKYVGIELHLPYRLTCLEFLIKLHGEAEPVIIFAEEKDEDIYILMSIKDQSNEWGLMYNSYVKINKTTYETTICLQDELEEYADFEQIRDFIQSYFAIAVTAITHFLCALACSNTHIEDDEVKPSPLKQKMRKDKGKLPLASYKVLTIKVGGSSSGVVNNVVKAPAQVDEKGKKRTHLRRGHIRKYQSGLKIWVNTCVVGSDRDNSVLRKSYNIKS